MLFLGAQYTLAAVASWAALSAIAGAQPLEETSATTVLAMAASGVVFIGVNGLLVAVGNIGTRYGSRSYGASVLRITAMAYAASFPLALLTAVAYRSSGYAVIPSLAGVLLVCAYAVRLTVENRLLAAHMRAVEALGRSCATEVRPEEPLRRFLALTRDLVAFQRAVLWTADDVGGSLRPRASYPGDVRQEDRKSVV